MSAALHPDIHLVTATRGEMCYCPGCSHAAILEKLGEALQRLALRPDQVCLVSDIGCIGTADRYFACHTFHGLHGRSITYAEGLKRARPEMTVIVVIGDGGCGIGTAHLVHAARRNPDITVLVANNFNFGMTGGQHSPTTPEDAFTTTTSGHHAERPFDICQTVAVNGAAFAARCSALDAHLTDRIEQAIRTPGFALVDIWELCVAYYVPSNRVTPKSLVELSTRLNMPFGVIQETRLPAAPESPTPAAAKPARSKSGAPGPEGMPLPWNGRREICIAGSAGQRIRAAAGIIGELAVAGGLHAAQQDDFPITVRKGHSVSYLIVDSRPIRYTGIDHAGLVILLSTEGAKRVDLRAAAADACVLADAAVPLNQDAVHAVPLSVRDLEHGAGKNAAALAALCLGLFTVGWIAPDDLLAAADAGLRGPYRDDNLKAVRLACDLFRAGRAASSTHPTGANHP